MKAATPAEYGAAYLDEHDPGWATRIDLTRLRMDTSCNCILGQLYSRGNVNGFIKFIEVHGELAARLGFDVPLDVPADLVGETFDCLEAEWSQLVASRQAQTTPTLTDPQEVTA